MPHPPCEYSSLGCFCDGEDSCCTESNQCGVNEGDCDSDVDCEGDLVCGTDNCNGPNFDSEDDCCTEKSEELEKFEQCRIGDGVGVSEVQLKGTFSKENCILAVREQYPKANGATMDAVCPSECNCYAEFGMEYWSASKKYTSCKFIPVCRRRDGKGSSEVQLEGKFTKENCILAVREQYPKANGATMLGSDMLSNDCWAEFGMESWSGSTRYRSCMFFKGDTSSVRDASDGNSTSIDNSGGDSLSGDSSGGDFSG